MNNRKATRIEPATLGIPRELAESICPGSTAASPTSSVFLLKQDLYTNTLSLRPMDPKTESLIHYLNSDRIVNQIRYAGAAMFDKSRQRWQLREVSDIEPFSHARSRRTYQFACAPIFDILYYTVIFFQDREDVLVVPNQSAIQDEMLNQIVRNAEPVTANLWKSWYHGWTNISNRWFFYLRNGSTHASFAFPTETSCACRAPVAASLALTERFLSYLEKIQNPALRWVTFLWFHAAALSSLLSGLDYRIPLGLNLQCSDANSLRYFEALFTWYGDPVIALGSDQNALAAQMMERKDQPLLLEGDFLQMLNVPVLSKAVADGEILLGEEAAMPLSSLPTVLSRSSTILNATGLFPAITVGREDLLDAAQENTVGNWLTDYIQTFNTFVSNNIRFLSDQLAFECVYCESDHVHSVRSTKTYAILLAVRQMVSWFYHSMNPDDRMWSRMYNMFAGEENPLLFAALDKTEQAARKGM